MVGWCVECVFTFNRFFSPFFVRNQAHTSSTAGHCELVLLCVLFVVCTLTAMNLKQC